MTDRQSSSGTERTSGEDEMWPLIRGWDVKLNGHEYSDVFRSDKSQGQIEICSVATDTDRAQLTPRGWLAFGLACTLTIGAAFAIGTGVIVP